MTDRPAIDPKEDLIVWLLAVRPAPVDYGGTGGVARLYDDLMVWGAAQEQVDDMIDVGSHFVHPRRHGMHFLSAASDHFKGYYGSEDKRHLYDGRKDWGHWLEAISDSPEQALERVFKWFDLFVEIHGFQAAKPRPIVRDTRPFVDGYRELQEMHKDPSLRPGDGSVSAAHQHLVQRCADPTIRIDPFSRLLRDNIEAMMVHHRKLVGRPVADDGDLDALASGTPNDDPWDFFLRAAGQLRSNHRGMGTSQGGVRDLITG